MWRLLALLGGFTVGWWSLLWLVLPVSWQRISPSAMLLLHIVPPVALTLTLRWWNARKEKKAEAERQQAEAAAEAERVAAREEARRRHNTALEERRQSIACHWLRCTALPVSDEPAWLAETDENCQWLPLERDQLEDDELLAALAEPQREALEALYLSAPGAAWLPVYTEVIPTQSGIEQLAALKSVQQEAAELALDSAGPAVECRFLPGHGDVAERARQALLQMPDCPGLVVLGFSKIFIAIRVLLLRQLYMSPRCTFSIMQRVDCAECTAANQIICTRSSACSRIHPLCLLASFLPLVLLFLQLVCALHKGTFSIN